MRRSPLKVTIQEKSKHCSFNSSERSRFFLKNKNKDVTFISTSVSQTIFVFLEELEAGNGCPHLEWTGNSL